MPGFNEDKRKAIMLKESLLLTAGNFLVQYLVIGTAYTCGIFLTPFRHEFETSAALTSIVGSTNRALFFISGLLSSYLLSRFGCPKVMVLGIIFTIFGILGAAYSSNIYFVFMCFGILTGTGNGLMYTSCLASVMTKINVHRAIFIGISMAGGSVGAMTLPVLVNTLITIYGWRGAMLILTAICMHYFLACEFIWIALRLQHHRHRLENYQRQLSIQSKGAIDVSYIQEKVDHHENNLPLRKLPSFWAIIINNLLNMFGFNVIVVHVVPYAEYTGASSEMASLLVTALGVGTFCGRISCGASLNNSKVSSQTIFQIGQFGMSLSCAGLALYSNYFYLCFCILVFGFSFGSHSSPLFETVLKMVGTERYAYAFAYMNCACGVGSLLGAPIAGWLYDTTSVYEYSFYLGGFMILLSGIILFLPLITAKCGKANNETTIEVHQEEKKCSTS